jgi:hypothetical protein
MTQTKTTNENKTVSTKLDAVTQSQLEAKAALLGVSVAEYLRNIAKDALAENVPVAPVVSNSNSPEPVAPAPALSENDLTAIVTAVSNVLEATLPAVAPSDKQAVVISADREHLRKLAGKSLETDYILSTEEEKYVSDLKEAIEADVLETMLLKQNSVPMPADLMSPLQKDMVQKMFEAREKFVSEKLPTLTTVLQKTIWAAFIEDASRLYNNSLFKATYGFEYREFKAVFEL